MFRIQRNLLTIVDKQALSPAAFYNNPSLDLCQENIIQDKDCLYLERKSLLSHSSKRFTSTNTNGLV
jgi:hypothetical protein